MTRRTEKIADTVQTVLAELLQRRVKDPILTEAFVSITRVDVAPDLSNARVHVSVLGEDVEAHDVLTALERSEPFLHREMGKELHLRRVPRLRFRLDESIAEGDRLTALMREVARSEGREL